MNDSRPCLDKLHINTIIEIIVSKLPTFSLARFWASAWSLSIEVLLETLIGEKVYP
jgi:hypothetical protein